MRAAEVRVCCTITHYSNGRVFGCVHVLVSLNIWTPTLKKSHKYFIGMLNGSLELG